MNFFNIGRLKVKRLDFSYQKLFQIETLRRDCLTFFINTVVMVRVLLISKAGRTENTLKVLGNTNKFKISIW